MGGSVHLMGESARWTTSGWCWRLFGVGFGVLIGIIFLAVFAMYFRLWLRAYFSRAGSALHARLLCRCGRSIRIHRRCASWRRAGLKTFPPDSLKPITSPRGTSASRCVKALIAAHRAKIPLNWNTCAAIDLAGRDVLEAVNTSVNPKVIDCPDGGLPRNTLDGVREGRHSIEGPR